MAPSKRKIFFLFNHDAPHQVAHLAGIVRAMTVERPDLDTRVAVGTPVIAARLREILGDRVSASVTWIDLALPRWMEATLSLPNRLAPIKRIMRLDHHAALLGEADTLVSAERTCLRLLRKWPAGHPTRMVHVPHGAGDRTVTYHPAMHEFDLMLVSGLKAARELLVREIIRSDRVRIIGYPKFDTVDLSARPRLFDNDNPVFLYNPHFDPLLSSWYDEGPKLLDWFASPEGQSFNVIFAPHIMLFRKAIHVSPEYRMVRRRPDIRSHWRAAPNILIDVDGPHLVDMTYTLAADGYIGDVSSQIYEFLVRPRPAFFFDRFSQDPRSKEGDLPFWQTGDVVTGVEELPALITNHAARGAHFRKAQKAIFAETFSLDKTHTASSRAAAAIAEFYPL